MHDTSPVARLRTLVVVAATAAGLAACAIQPPPRQQPTGPQVIEAPRADEPAATTTPLAETGAATSPWDYIALARQASGEQRSVYILDAIEGFIDLGQSATARTLLEQLEAEPLPAPLAARRENLLARSYFEEGQYDRVEAILRPLSGTPGLDASNAAAAMLLRARALAATGSAVDALNLLTAREPLLQDVAAVEDNQNIIWEVLAALDTDELTALRNDRSRLILAQWADLALVSQRYGWNYHELRLQLETWRQVNPSHPASRVLIPNILAGLGSGMTEYRRVALLLPLSSGFGAAAQAVYDGFTMMYEADSNPRKPQVTLYDIGENAELVGFYYQAAVRDGAELVVGPLGKVAVDALVANTELTVPTLLLGNTDAGLAGRRNVFQFGLSPEDEAVQVARRAHDQGYRVAAALYPETDWGLRQLDAFSAEWRNLGGTLAESAVYQAEGDDHSRAIQLLLNLDESEGRHRRLEQLTGTALEFVAKPRTDLDFIFMIARSRQGRLLKPQINYFKGNDIPVYAISQIYGGPDPVNDIDLDGVIFGDMPWLLSDSGVYEAIREDLPEGGKYRGGPLDRLFALGIDTYQLLFRLEAMKNNPNLRFDGTTGEVSLAPGGTIVRRLDWARFDEGEAEPLGMQGALAGRTGQER